MPAGARSTETMIGTAAAECMLGRAPPQELAIAAAAPVTVLTLASVETAGTLTLAGVGPPAAGMVLTLAVVPSIEKAKLAVEAAVMPADVQPSTKPVETDASKKARGTKVAETNAPLRVRRDNSSAKRAVSIRLAALAIALATRGRPALKKTLDKGGVKGSRYRRLRFQPPRADRGGTANPALISQDANASERGLQVA